MEDDFSKYESLRRGGAPVDAAYLKAMEDGLDAITRIRLIRLVYSLTPREAKEVFNRVENNDEK